MGRYFDEGDSLSFLVMFLFSLTVAHNVRNAVILVSPCLWQERLIVARDEYDHKYAADLVAASTFAPILIVPFWLLLF